MLQGVSDCPRFHFLALLPGLLCNLCDEIKKKDEKYVEDDRNDRKRYKTGVKDKDDDQVVNDNGVYNGKQNENEVN